MTWDKGERKQSWQIRTKSTLVKGRLCSCAYLYRDRDSTNAATYTLVCPPSALGIIFCPKSTCICFPIGSSGTASYSRGAMLFFSPYSVNADMKL